MRRVAALVAFAVACGGQARAGEKGGELVCAPSRGGCVTAWLVAGPMPFLRDAEIDRDFLKGAGGEAAARPREGQVADPVRGLTWQARVFPDNVLSLKDECLPVGESVFYLSALLEARRDLEATLLLRHTGWARVWIDGKRVAKSDHNPFAVGVAAHRLRLRKGARTHCLLKVGSNARRVQFLLGLVAGTKLLGPADLHVVLPVDAATPAAVAAHAFSALSLSLERGPRESGHLVQPGQETRVRFGVLGGYPVCAGKVAAEITIKDATGRVVHTLKAPPASLAELAAAPARLRWTPPKEGGTASYDLVAHATYDGAKIGALSQTVYSQADLSKWNRELGRRLAQLQKARKIDDDAAAHVLLKIEKANLLNVQGAAPDLVYGELEVAERWLRRLQGGKTLPPPLEPGVHELAYHATQDGSAQPYYLHVPRSYTGRKPIPAVVYLHGYAPDLDKTNWHMPSYALRDQAEAHGYALIVPFARSNTDFQAIGEVDVLHVLRLAQKHLKIDPDRIYLVGYSMGGMGAYTIAAHYPHLWAGVVALCARADYYYWKELDPAKVEPFKRHVLDMEFGWPLAGNFRHLPVLAYQGTADFLIEPEQAQRFVGRLTRLGSSAQVVHLAGRSHWIADEVFSTPRAFEWMARHRRVDAARTIRYKTYSPRYGRAYWLTIDAFAEAGKPASVDLTLGRDTRLTLAATNVARLTLRPPRSLVRRGTPLPATVNGKAITLRPGRRGEYVVPLAKAPAALLRKTASLCGPIKDAFNRRFALVFGTTGSPDQTLANRRAARRVGSDWYTFAKGKARLYADVDLLPVDGPPSPALARTDLFLFGTPDTNAILAKIAGKLPIKFTKDGYDILGRPHKATATTGLMFIYPNPLAPDRYVVVCSGAHYGRKLSDNHKYDLLPDFILFEAVPPPPAAPPPGVGPAAGRRGEADYDGSDPYYAAGFFDNTWQLRSSLIWTSNGRPKPKPAAPRRPAAPTPGPLPPP